jgi:hypothetical protein
MQALLAKRALVERQLKAIAARQTAARRKAQARAKFILGDALLRRAAADPELLKWVLSILAPKDQVLVQAVISQHAPPGDPATEQ